MESRDILTAAALLAALRRDGCEVAADGDTLRVTGKYSDMQRAMIVAGKAELLTILAVEGLIAAETAKPIATPLVSSEIAPSAPEPAPSAVVPSSPKSPPSPLLPHGPVVAGVAVMTAEMLRWRALRDQALCRGERFDLPPPRYRYPEFETSDE